MGSLLCSSYPIKKHTELDNETLIQLIIEALTECKNYVFKSNRMPLKEVLDFILFYFIYKSDRFIEMISIIKILEAGIKFSNNRILMKKAARIDESYILILSINED